MEKVRRGGGSRFSTAKRCSVSGENNKKLLTGFGGDLQFSEKSKKEKVRSLSAVAKALSSTTQMGCHLSHKPNASPKTKRFKLPKKKQFLNGCNGVDPASVPRKIRSAMKKRSRESMLSDSEKVSHKINNGTESPGKDRIKKSKVGSIKQGSPGDWSTREAVCGPITKDEEEVAETLYALAGMFPVNNASSSNALPHNSILQDPEQSPNATIEASGTAQDASPCPERSPKGHDKISFVNETSNGQEKTDFSGSAKFLVAPQSAAQKINLQALPVMVSSDNDSKVALHDSELSLATGLNMPKRSQVSHIERKPVVEFQRAGGVECKQEQHIIKGGKETGGPTLWPGLSPSPMASAAEKNASYLQSSAAKAPDWLNAAALCVSKQDFTMDSCSSGGKISEVGIHRKSWKSCAAHVHISHLIRSLEVPKRQTTKEPELYECQQMRVHKGSKCEAFTEARRLNGMRNGISFAAGTVYSSTGRNSHENKNGVLKQLCHYQGMSPGPPTPVVDGPQKQSFNFLSLSTGGNGLKVNDNLSKVGSRTEPLSKLQVPYFQSLQQQHGLMPIHTPQIQYASTSYINQLPVAGPQVRLQQPHYYGSPLRGSYYSSTVSNKQQQQSYWAVQLASQQGRSAENCNTVSSQCPPNWQSGSSSITEQKIFALASSLPQSRTNGLVGIHIPSVCEESRARFRGTGTPSLQLLCDERI